MRIFAALTVTISELCTHIFRMLCQPIASQSHNSIFDSPNRLSKVLWGYWRRKHKTSLCAASKFPALRAVWFADLCLNLSSDDRCKPIQKPFKGAHHITGGEPCVYDYPSSEGSDIDKKGDIS